MSGSYLKTLSCGCISLDMRKTKMLCVFTLIVLLCSCANTPTEPLLTQEKIEIEMVIYPSAYKENHLVLDITNNTKSDTISLLSYMGYYCHAWNRTKKAERWRTDITEISRLCAPRKIAPNENMLFYLDKTEPIDSAVYSIDYELNGSKVYRNIEWGK